MIGKSPYVDPFLVSTLLSVRLPLHPGLKLNLVSRYSIELVHEVLDGTLDLAIANHPAETALLTRVQVEETSFYIAMAKTDPLSSGPDIDLASLDHRLLILFERRLHPALYDWILEEIQESGARIEGVQQVTTPEEAFPSVLDGTALAFIVKSGALLLSRSGVTVRPVTHDRLKLKTYLISRSDNESKLVSELVRSLMRKLTLLSVPRQMALPTILATR